MRMILDTGDGSFRVWDLAADPPRVLAKVPASFPADNAAPFTVVIAPNGESIIAGHLNGAVRFWNVSANGVMDFDPLVPNPRLHTFEHQVKVIDRFLCASTETSLLPKPVAL